jgi:hypothetical protein
VSVVFIHSDVVVPESDRRSEDIQELTVVECLNAVLSQGIRYASILMKSPREEQLFPPGPHLWVVDRLDGDTASVEVDGATIVNMPIWLLPEDAIEGDVFRVKHDRRNDRSILMIVSDEQERQRRVARSELQASVRSPKDRSGDITL